MGIIVVPASSCYILVNAYLQEANRNRKAPWVSHYVVCEIQYDTTTTRVVMRGDLSRT